MKIVDLLEVTVIGNNSSNFKPLRENDTVRVYHGTSKPTAVTALQYGISGGAKVFRTYSYENNNNPKGLFVSPHIKTAKYFGEVVLEFHTRVRDLEAPVWPSGGFTVQGQMATYFKDDEDRNDAALRQRLKLKDHELDYVRDSDRPDLAYWFLTTGESQALYTGDLNANSIRAVWVDGRRMAPKQFLSTIEPNYMDGDKLHGKARGRLLKPQDAVSGVQYVDMMVKRHNFDRGEMIKVLKDHPDYIRKNTWSDRQYERIKRDVDRM